MDTKDIETKVTLLDETEAVAEIHQISIMGLLNKKPIIHTCDNDDDLQVEVHTHGRAGIGELDMKAIFPLGYQSTNLDPSIFEVIINSPPAEAHQLCADRTVDYLFSKDTPTDDEYVKYTVFIVKEVCEVEKINGQMLPYRFVRVFWSYEKDADYDKATLPYRDVIFYGEDDDEVLSFKKENSKLLEEFINTVIKKAVDDVNSRFLDSIGLDFDLPNLETITNDDTLKSLADDFYAVYEQLPDNPVFLHSPPRDMPKDKLHVYGVCYNENIDLYNTKCSISIDNNNLDKETLDYVKDVMKCRVAIYVPDDLDDDILKDWDFTEIKTHRSILFVPLDMFNMETMTHLNDDVNRRLNEVYTFFESFDY
jgi:hypothetical protein